VNAFRFPFFFFFFKSLLPWAKALGKSFAKKQAKPPHLRSKPIKYIPAQNSLFVPAWLSSVEGAPLEKAFFPAGKKPWENPNC